MYQSLRAAVVDRDASVFLLRMRRGKASGKDGFPQDLKTRAGHCDFIRDETLRLGASDRTLDQRRAARFPGI